MGSCFSSESSKSSAPSTAKVISTNGNLLEYYVPITVSQVLQMESSSSSSSSPFFLCNSDSLYYDEYIPPLDSAQHLQAGQIYFVLPLSRSHYRLSASDMAALAVKASLALSQSSTKDGIRRKKIRVSPVFDVNYTTNSIEDDDFVGFKSFQKPKQSGITRSGSMKKLQRNGSRRTRLAMRSFRLKLSTIYEGRVAEW
ncbi:PREDICTED: uncharacterized protein LOC104603845 [Nelumbo nucifera]|uniref:Uncharacterized protein LOC104603845 n=1 Tax=Nelumbo nucifera TaxID=4432 RepID=A0A1U8AT82_NELNU|nr:PREDICTED: uncharacterized protein LOC104603845 [Nelumbo nucifera]